MHLDRDSVNEIMGICAGSWMDGCTIHSLAFFSVDTALNSVGYALDGILAWIPMAFGFGIFPLRVIPRIALLVIKLRGYYA